MRAWRLAIPLLTLSAAACVLDSSGLLLSDADDDGTSTTTTGGFGGQPTTTSATGGTTTSATTSTASTGGQGGAATSGTGGDGGGVVDGWSHRMNVTVQALTAPVPAGYSVFVDLAHAQLVGATQALANGDDVYVVRDDGSTLQVIDRVVDPSSGWNQGATRIWFETSSAIPAGMTDADYWIYYGNPQAPAPPADPGAVFLKYDDFSMAPPGWVHSAIGSGATGNAATSAGNLHIEGTTGQIYGQSDSFYFARFPVSGSGVAVRAKVVASGGSLPGYAVLGGVMIRQSDDPSSRFVLATPAGGYYLTYNSPPKYPANRANTYRLSFNTSAAEDTANDPSGLLPVVVEAARYGLVGRSYYASDGLTFNPIGASHLFVTWSDSSYLVGVAFANHGSGVGFADVDWFLMRAYVDPEPIVVPGAIETGPFTLP